ncbi:MAG: copper transporter [Acidimicrobiales bacterium]
MINFRFHLVSLTGVFLALAVGIVFGASVVNSGAVDGLRGQLGSVKADVSRVDQQNELLRRDLGGWIDFSKKAGPGILAGRLQGVPVLVLGVRGMDAQPVADLRNDLESADARVQGTVWLTSKMQLDNPDDVQEVALALGLGTPDVDVVRRSLFSRLADELVAAGTATPAVPSTLPGATTVTTLPGVTTTTVRVAPEGGVLATLSTLGFLKIDSPESGPFNTSLPLPGGTRFVIASGEGADVPDPVGAIPLVKALTAASGTNSRVVAVEPGRPTQGREPEVRARFIGPLRAEGKDLDTRISTVNNVEDFRGRVAAVLALADLGVGRVGHYGTGSGADRPVPESG